MATLEGNELVNVESVTALMALFGAKYMGTYISTSAFGFVANGNPSYTKKIVIASDGSTVNIPNISEGAQDIFTCSWSLTADKGGLFFMRSSYSVLTTSSHSSQKITITPKTSLNTTTFTPANFIVSNPFSVAQTDTTLFETMFRLKDGETFSYKEAYDLYTTGQSVQTYFELYRLC